MTNDDLAALADYRAVFDRALAESRAATDAAAATDPSGTGPVKAREEVSRALNQAEGDFWRAWAAAHRQQG